MMRDIAFSTGKGVAGMLSAGLTYTVASIASMTPIIQFVGVAIGVVVGLLTIVSVAMDVRKKWLNRNRE